MAGGSARLGWPRLVERDVIVPGLDPDHDGVRIAHLTDLHVGLLTPHRRIRRAFEMAQAAEPDVLFLTGDYLCYSPKFVGVFAEITRAIRVPAYAILGNHDHWTDAQGATKALRRAGVDVLSNSHTTMTLRHSPLEIVGIDDPITSHADVARAFSGTHRQRSRVVLSHVPSMIDRACDFGPGLALAGHTHGGHLHIPRVTAHFFRKLGAPYLKGFYDVGPMRLYVNCGVGASSVPIRAGAPSEVAVLTLRAA